MTVMTEEYERILKEERLKRIRTAREFSGAKRGSGKHLHYLGTLAMPDGQIYYTYSLDDEATRDQVTGIVPHILLEMDTFKPRWANNQECLMIMTNVCPPVYID